MYIGELRYPDNNSGREGQYVKFDLALSFFPGIFAVQIRDPNAHAIHSLANRMFNYQAMDSPKVLLAREKRHTEWNGRFVGDVYLQRPRIANVPLELQVHVVCSLFPTFAVIELILADKFYQLSRRPPRGMHNCARLAFAGDRIRDPHLPDEHSSDSRRPPEDPSSDSRQPPSEETPSLGITIAIRGSGRKSMIRTV